MIIALLLISISNVLLFFTGNYLCYKKLFPDDSKGISLLISFAVSITFLSFIYYATLILHLGFEAILVLLTIYNVLRFFWPRNNKITIKIFNISLSQISTTAFLVLFVLTLFFAFCSNKYGGIDAWLIWNSHAKFLYYPEIWTRLINGSELMAHADYPLMISSLVAFGWHCINNLSFAVPLLLSYFIYIITALLLYKSLKDEALLSFGLIALIMFATDRGILELATGQEADTALALFILITFVLYYHTTKTVDNTKIYLVGFISASCGWIKNEGVAFYLLFGIMFLIANRRNYKNVIRFACGSFIPLIVIFSFKWFFAPPNDIMGANSHSFPLQKLTDASRYVMIIKFYISMLMAQYPYLLILIIILFLKPNKKLMLPILVLIALMVVYFAIYVVTPKELKWHLANSLNRLFEHIYPSFIYLTFLSCKDNPVVNKLLSNNSVQTS